MTIEAKRRLSPFNKRHHEGVEHSRIDKLVTAVERHRRAIVLLVQLTLVSASYALSFVLRLDLQMIPLDLVLKSLPLLIVVRMGSLTLFRLHKGLWRYVSVVDLVQTIKATTVSTLIFVALFILIFGVQGFPRSIFVLDWAGNIFLLSGIRLFTRVVREQLRLIGGQKKGELKRLLVVGAGDAGAAICAQALSNPQFRFRPVAIVDGDSGKVGTTIQGVRVAGRFEDIPRLIVEYGADTIVIAVDSSPPSVVRNLVEICRGTGAPFKILPPASDIIAGTVNVSRIRDVDPGDLLGRPTAELDSALIQGFISGSRVLVTGAGGSVGSELARKILPLQPSLILLIDHAENPLFFLETELRSAFPDASLIVEVADVTDKQGMCRLMAAYRPEVVFHAAAHKHVPLMERSPAEAIKNNVGGTYTMATSAIDAGVRTFVLVSTDKAVNPTSVMGATKRVAELLVQELDDRGSTQLVSVRFGNVLGSDGSVVPIFKRQIANGGPVTVTHRDAERFFMSLPEAAGLILQAGALGSGGEIFVLDMGEPVRIVALAELLISLSGLEPIKDIDIVYTGLRPGEKLSEELQFPSEQMDPTGYEKLLMIKDASPPTGILIHVESLLQTLAGLSSHQAGAALQHIVSLYQPAKLVTEGSKHPAASAE